MSQAPDFSFRSEISSSLIRPTLPLINLPEFIYLSKLSIDPQVCEAICRVLTLQHLSAQQFILMSLPIGLSVFPLCVSFNMGQNMYHGFC